MQIDITGYKDVIELVPAANIQEEQNSHDTIADEASQHCRTDDRVIIFASEKVRDE
jgi:hypothetical protein